jgi:hypothetical protein
MRSGFLSSGETFETPAVDKKYVQPAVVVVVVESDAAACGFEKILVLVLAAVDGFGIQAGCARDVKKGNAEIIRGSSSGRLLRNCSPSDWRNARRVEDKRTDTFPCEPRAKIRRFLL